MVRIGELDMEDDWSSEELSSYQVNAGTGGSILTESRKREGRVILMEGSVLRVRCGAGVFGK